MRTGIIVHLSLNDRNRLRAIVNDRNSAQRDAWRVQIVLATADGLGTSAIMRTAGVRKTAVWGWQERFMAQRVDGLLWDPTRPASAQNGREVASASSRSPWANRPARPPIGSGAPWPRSLT
jgi:hypothetical protein